MKSAEPPRLHGIIEVSVEVARFSHPLAKTGGSMHSSGSIKKSDELISNCIVGGYSESQPVRPNLSARAAGGSGLETRLDEY